MQKILIIILGMVAAGSLKCMERRPEEPKLPKVHMSALEAISPEKKSPLTSKRLFGGKTEEEENSARKKLKFDEEAKQLTAVTAKEKGGRILLEASLSDELILATQTALEMDGDPNFVSTLGYTPLHNAVRSICPETTRLLLKYGANPTTPDRYIKDTPLHLAVCYSYSWDEKIFTVKNKILRMLLLSAEIDSDSINAQNSFGNTPLLRLLDPRQEMPAKYRIALTNRLIDAGASCSVQNTFGKNATELAKECGCDVLATQMQQQVDQKK